MDCHHGNLCSLNNDFYIYIYIKYSLLITFASVFKGDGVENAFSYSKKVFTFSVHNYEAGYFPGTGDIKDVGFGRGKFYTANMPLKSGIDNESFLNILER